MRQDPTGPNTPENGEASEIVAVLYPGGDAADNPEVLGGVEHALGLGDSLGDEHELVSATRGAE